MNQFVCNRILRRGDTSVNMLILQRFWCKEEVTDTYEQGYSLTNIKLKFQQAAVWLCILSVLGDVNDHGALCELSDLVCNVDLGFSHRLYEGPQVLFRHLAIHKPARCALLLDALIQSPDLLDDRLASCHYFHAVLDCLTLGADSWSLTLRENIVECRIYQDIIGDGGVHTSTFLSLPHPVFWMELSWALVAALGHVFKISPDLNRVYVHVIHLCRALPELTRVASWMLATFLFGVSGRVYSIHYLLLLLSDACLIRAGVH